MHRSLVIVLSLMAGAAAAGAEEVPLQFRVWFM